MTFQQQLLFSCPSSSRLISGLVLVVTSQLLFPFCLHPTGYSSQSRQSSLNISQPMSLLWSFTYWLTSHPVQNKGSGGLIHKVWSMGHHHLHHLKAFLEMQHLRPQPTPTESAVSPFWQSPDGSYARESLRWSDPGQLSDLIFFFFFNNFLPSLLELSSPDLTDISLPSKCFSVCGPLHQKHQHHQGTC